MVEDGPVNGVGPGISLGYEFDAVGNLWKLRDGKQAEPPLRVYAYDGLDRLTAARDAAGTDQQTYAYDRTGNRTASGYWQVTGTADCSGVPPGDPCTPGEPVSTWKTRTYDYVPQKHHLWTIGYTERHYDATGNTIWIGPKSVEQPPGDGDPGPGDPGGGETESAAYAGTEQSMIGLDDGTEPPPGIVEKTFVYNAANRLASVSDGGVLTMSYRYNGAGERVYRTGSDKTVHTVFDPAGHWIGDYDGYGQPLQQAIWLGDLPVGLVARIDGLDRLFYVEPDALGSPRVVIDPTRDAANGGMAVWRWPLTGDAFGEEAPYEDPDGDGTAFVLDLRFPGQQYDSATGFNYNYFRDYDPSTGRYVESDPIGLRGGISTYGYVGGNPMIGTDLMGLATCTYVISTGALTCIPDQLLKLPIQITVASGNNGEGLACKNNPYCTHLERRGPIPQGNWHWNINAWTGKKNGRVLEPDEGTQTFGRTLIRSHSCPNPFGASLGPKFCSEGCVTGRPADMRRLNQLLDAEPNSSLRVISFPEDANVEAEEILPWRTEIFLGLSHENLLFCSCDLFFNCRIGF